MLLYRVISAVIGIALFLGVLRWGRIPFFILVSFIILLGLWELYTMLQRIDIRPNFVLGMVGGIGFSLGALLEGEKGLEFVLIIAVVVFFFWYLLVLGKTEATLNCSYTLFGSLYVGFLLSYLILIRDLSSSWLLIVFVLATTWVSDTAGYIGGRFWGKRKMAPRLSPSKTWEGAVAAVVVTTTVAVFLPFIPELDFTSRAILGLIVSLASQLGDLAESGLKREMGVKDASRLIPGHGGILDRFDSLLFSGFAAYYFLKVVL